jgi:hypothetical protein
VQNVIAEGRMLALFFGSVAGSGARFLWSGDLFSFSYFKRPLFKILHSCARSIETATKHAANQLLS